MAVSDKPIEKLKKYLWNHAVDFCLIYRFHGGQISPEISCIDAFSRSASTSESREKLACIYQALAGHCFKTKRSIVFQELIIPEGSPTISWFGLERPTGVPRVPMPANSAGQSWWYLIVASGATYKAGYVVIIKVAANEARDLRRYFVEIQCTLAEVGFFLRSVIHFRSHRKWIMGPTPGYGQDGPILDLEK